MTNNLSNQQFMRYSRQIMMEDWGEVGQLVLASANVLVIGCGGLGNVVATYLAGAGVGHITLVDDDTVELSNLPRQIAFDSDSVDNAKAFELSNRLREQNPEVVITPIVEKFSQANAKHLLVHCGLVIDCTDNFSTRYLINQQCLAHKIPLISGSVIGWQGQLLMVDPAQPQWGCYQCLFSQSENDNAQGSCSTLGVSGPMVGIVASYQANEALRYLLGLPSKLAQSLCLIDGSNLNMQTLTRTRQENCPACATQSGQTNEQ